MHILQPEIMVLTVLSVLFAIFDHQTRRVPVFLFILGTILGISVSAIGRREIVSVLAAMIPGILLVVLSVCTEGGIGIGDGHYFLIAALFLEWRETVLLAVLSFSLAAAVSLGMILAGCFTERNMKKKKLPFLVFMPVSLLAIFCI